MTIDDIAKFALEKYERVDASHLFRLRSMIKRRYQMIWDQHPWREALVVASQSVTGVGSITAATGVVEIDSATMELVMSARWNSAELLPIEKGAVFQLDPASLDSVGTPAYFANDVLASDGSPQVRLYPYPQTTGTLVTLGKKKFTVPADTDTPKLPGVEPALIAFAEADLMERIGMPDKATAKFTEAAAHVQRLLELERRQSAQMTRLIPWMEGEPGLVGPSKDFS